MNMSLKVLRCYPIVLGVTHNIPLLRDVMSHPRFIEGNLTTAFLAEEYPEGFQGHIMSALDKDNLTAVIASVWYLCQSTKFQWIKGGGSFINHHVIEKAQRMEWSGVIRLGEGGDSIPVTVVGESEKEFKVESLGKSFSVDMTWPMESSLIRANVTGADGVAYPVIAQYLDSLPLGLRVSFYGTKVS